MRPVRLAFAILLAAPLGVVAQTQVYIGVSGQNQAPPVIGMPPFMTMNGQTAGTETARRLREVVRADLLFSRWFNAAEAPSAEAAASPAAHIEDWKKAGAAFVLSVSITDTEPKIFATASLLDLASGQSILDRYYRQDARYWRSEAHQIADDIVRQLTGKPGIAHTHIAFVNNADGGKEVYLIDYDGAELRRLTTDRSIDILPRWSPDGGTLIYTSYRRGNPDLYAFDMGKGTSRVFLDRQGLNVAGGYSPDGNRLVLTLSREKNPNLFLMNTANGSLQELTHYFGIDTSPTFSPDGEQIAFVSDRSGNPQVHVLNLSTQKVTRLTRLNWCDTPSWSPTGEWIAFSGRANALDPMDIFLVDITGEHVRQLTHGEGSNEDPSWSPDGRFLAFTSTRDKARRLYVMDHDGSAPHPVANIPGDSFTPAWSP